LNRQTFQPLPVCEFINLTSLVNRFYAGGVLNVRRFNIGVQKQCVHCPACMAKKAVHYTVYNIHTVCSRPTEQQTVVLKSLKYFISYFQDNYSL